MKILTENQLNSIKDILKDELTKRGFHVEINLVEAETRDKNKLRLSSSKFQTTPVLFKELSLTDFGTEVSIRQHKDIFGGDKENEVISIWLSVNVAYTHFDLGSNTSKLFDFTCVMFESNDRCFKVNFS